MFFDDEGRFGVSHLYPSQKAFILPLKKKGFFSEFGILINAMAFAIIDGRHLFVSTHDLTVSWDQLFDLPMHDPALVNKINYPARSPLVLKPQTREAFDRMATVLMHNAGRPAIKLPQIGFKGSLERLISDISKAAFKPTFLLRKQAKWKMMELGLDDQKFYAIQVRGGDKLVGTDRADGKGLIEGEFVPSSRYMDPILADSPNPLVFVITDDYREVESLQRAYKQASFVTLCPPDHHGYFHAHFAGQDLAKRNLDAQQLVVQVLIASRAKLFLGPYLSNLSRFVHQLRFPRPSLSVDSEKHWAPSRTVPSLPRKAALAALAEARAAAQS